MKLWLLLSRLSKYCQVFRKCCVALSNSCLILSNILHYIIKISNYIMSILYGNIKTIRDHIKILQVINKILHGIIKILNKISKIFSAKTKTCQLLPKSNNNNNNLFEPSIHTKMHLEESEKRNMHNKTLIITNTKKYTNNDSQTINTPQRKIYDWLRPLSESTLKNIHLITYPKNFVTFRDITVTRPNRKTKWILTKFEKDTSNLLTFWRHKNFHNDTRKIHGEQKTSYKADLAFFVKLTISSRKTSKGLSQLFSQHIYF